MRVHAAAVKEASALSARAETVFAYLELMKVRLVSLVILTTAAGYFLGAPILETGRFFTALVFTFLAASGSMALNQYLERDIDARMIRTRSRPLPSGRVGSREALFFGAALSLAGLSGMVFFAGMFAGSMSLLAWTGYLFVYTPLKRKSPLATLAGAVFGALPPVIGWAAAHGEAGFKPLILFLIMFFWQVPHFLAIAWLYREDYARAQLPALPAIDRSGRLLARQMVLYACALTLASLFPTLLGLTALLYFFLAFVLGILFLSVVIRAAGDLDRRAGQALFASIAYLFLIFLFMAADKA